MEDNQCKEIEFVVIVVDCFGKMKWTVGYVNTTHALRQKKRYRMLYKERDAKLERESRYIRSLAQKAFDESNSQNSPKCPLCKSKNIRKTSAAKRIAHGAAFGLFSNTARSQWECLNCGNKF